MREELKQKIDILIKENPVVLFMKGTKDWPECGFSKRVVDILKHLNIDFVSINVLLDAEVREGIKVYSSWPTIPQLYINGDFIGGCDIALDMFQKGELEKLLANVIKEMSPEELNYWHQEKRDILLLDVRTKEEWEMAHIPFAKLFSEMSPNEIEKLKKDQAIVFHCHHGGRSKKMAKSFMSKGFTNVYNLTGGIDAWSKSIDSNIPTYN